MEQKPNNFKTEMDVMKALDVVRPEDLYPVINPLFIVQIKGKRTGYGWLSSEYKIQEKTFDITYPISVENAVECVHMIKMYKEDILNWDLKDTSTVWQEYMYEAELVPEGVGRIIEVNMFIDINGIRTDIVPRP